MTEERWKRIADLYESAQDKDATERSAFVREATADDSGVRRDVESLLAADETPVLLDESLAAAAHAVFADNSGVSVDSGSGQVGTTIGPYRIDSLLGVGGMGEVYRARDTKLNRDVAIKILPPAFASDPDRLARFKREAQVLASLNHPNIGGIYGFEDAGGIHALILELVEGPTLADRIDPGQLPLDEALAIARQITDALEAAHEQGIIHRDLKPANIKVREDGTVKVLDFGLAKIAEAGGAGTAGRAGENLTQSPTITTPAMTAAGMILGTAAYMSPEQAKGKPADKRSDIWAFGCVLYEMLTGKRPFEGEDVSDTLAAILRAEPEWSALPSSTPASIQRLLRRCLLKDRKQRIGDAATLRLEIDEARLEPPHLSPAPAPRHRSSLMPVVAAAVMAGLLGAGATLWLARDRTTEPQELRVDIATPDSREPSSLALSPDDSKIVYVVDSSGRSQLWLRELQSGAARALEGTIGGVFPFWSPNSRSVGFFADGRLKRIDIGGGPARDIAPAPGSRAGGSWGPDGTILFNPSNQSGLSAVSQNGGTVRELTHPQPPDEQAHRAAVFLPDAKHFLFFTAGSARVRGVYAGSLDGTTSPRLVETDASAVYLRGHLLFLRGNTLFARAFDPERLTLTGDDFRVAEPVNSNGAGVAAISASTGNTLAFRKGVLGDRRQLVWFDRSGKQLEALGDADVGTRMSNPDLSASGRRVAIGRAVNNASDIWTMELGRSAWTRVTTLGVAAQPVWSPDDQQLAIISAPNANLYVRPAAPGGSEQSIVSSPELKGITDWSADGNHLIFNVRHTEQNIEIWTYSFAEKRAFAVVKQSGANQADAQLSPDGKWVAYQSDQSGRFEIYVQPFLSAGDAVPVSNAGGAQVRWRKDGRELDHVDLDERLVAVPIAPSSDGKSIEPGRPQSLFQVRLPGGTLQSGGNHQQYSVSDDGQRFLVNTLLPDPEPTPITLILNWKGRP